MIFHGCCFTATQSSSQLFQAFTATFLWSAYLTRIEQLLKYQLGVWEAPTANVSCQYKL